MLIYTRRSLQRKEKEELIDIILDMQNQVTIETAYEFDNRFGIPFPQEHTPKDR